MTVRPATLQDVPKLVQLAQLEHARSRFRAHRFDRNMVIVNMEEAVRGMLTRVLISDTGLGFIAGVLQRSLYNREFLAYELAWYAEDGSGMELLDAFCEWARKMRAADVVLSNYGGIVEPEKFTRVMRRKGFACVGSTYSKAL